ncbi:ABC transporter permease [Microbacterium lushaniae]|nr:ABC transporter permease [Microbacterium lushaniae]KAA9159859.1 ABC transporter permease [Microbacterium lushaniae]
MPESPTPIPTTTSEVTPVVTESAWRGAARRFVAHRAAVIGLIVIVLAAVVALIAPLLPLDPYATDLTAPRAAPSPEHLLGTDVIGRDVLARLVWGARVSLLVGFASVALMALIGVVAGSLSGYFGGWVDQVIMRVADVIMSFPSMLIVLALVAIAGPSMWNIIIAIGVTQWPQVARLVRSSFLTLREQDYVKAAVVLGAHPVRIMARHILPLASGPLMIAATFAVASAILMEAGLSFLGVGVQPPTASWGNLLTDAQSLSVLATMPWLWLPPSICIAVVVLCINFVGDGLRDALDPHSEQQ